MKKIKLFTLLAAMSISVATQAIGDVITSLEDYNSVIKLGDLLNLSSEYYESFSINGQAFNYEDCPYKLVLGNINENGSSDYRFWTVTEDGNGAYYIFKDKNGTLYSTGVKLARTSRTNGVKVDNYTEFMGIYYTIITNEPSEDFTDTEEGIESRLAALVGETVKTNITRTFYKDGYFNTLCLPFSLDADAIAADYYLGYQCEIFEFESAEMNGGTLDLYLNQVYAIEAGKPYLIRWEEDLWHDSFNHLYFEGVTITASEGQAVGTGVQFVGTIGQTQLENGNTNYLFLGRNNTLYWPNSNNKMKGFRAYFKVSGSVAPHGAPARMVIRKSPTAVENVQGTEINAKKVIRDCQLIIMCNGVEYNANGQAIK